MNKQIIVLTRLRNEDNLKVTRLIDTYTKSGTIIDILGIGDGTVKITFLMKRTLIKKFKKDINLLNYVGIIAKIEV